jgi:hypothetical protein
MLIITEAMFATILGAYRLMSNHALHDACVYGNPSQVLKWSGACLGFCLLEPLRQILSFQPLKSWKPRSKEDKIMQWKGQKDWFLAYDTKNDPQSEHDLTVEGDSNAEGQIKGSLSKDAEEVDRSQLVEGQLDEELDDEEMADAEQVDDEDDNLSS